MNLKRISSSTIAVFIAALLVLITGIHTENGGFQLAGVIFLLVGCVLAFNQVRKGDDLTD